MIGAAQIEFLESPAGEAALEQARSFPPSLPLHTRIDRLRKTVSAPLAAAAIEMTELQDRARDKFSLAPRLFFTKEALEQSSGEIVARYRARRFAGSGLTADLCCGIGGDAMALASVTPTIALDRDATRLACCRHNLAVSNPAYDCSLVLADALEYPLAARTAFIDPSRREDGRRVRAGEDYSPPLSFALGLSKKLDGLGVKVAPGLDTDVGSGSAAGPGPDDAGTERELVSLDGVCREMVLWWGRLAQSRRRASVLRRVRPGSFDFRASVLESNTSSDPSAPVSPELPRPGEWILEPDPAVIRARLVERLAENLGGRLIDPRIAYLVTAERPETTFGAAYAVVESFRYQELRLREWLAARHIGHLIVKKRGFPHSPEEVVRRMKLKGSESATVILTRREDEHVALIVTPGSLTGASEG